MILSSSCSPDSSYCSLSKGFPLPTSVRVPLSLPQTTFAHNSERWRKQIKLCRLMCLPVRYHECKGKASKERSHSGSKLAVKRNTYTQALKIVGHCPHRKGVLLFVLLAPCFSQPHQFHSVLTQQVFYK